MSTEPLFKAEVSPADAVDQQIVELLHGLRNGPLGEHLDSAEMAVLRLIRYRRGVANAISIREIQEKLDLGEREIKQIVRTLRIDFRLPIGSSKNGSTGGYFIIASIEDQAVAVAGPLAQIRAEAEILKVLTNPERTRELLGQIQLEVH